MITFSDKYLLHTIQILGMKYKSSMETIPFLHHTRGPHKLSGKPPPTPFSPVGLIAKYMASQWDAINCVVPQVPKHGWECIDYIIAHTHIPVHIVRHTKSRFANKAN